ncbi:MAG: hypothetical protein ABI432_04125 [Flavobacteriales bacterium]
MWLHQLAVELFVEAALPTALGFVVLRDGEPVYTGTLQRSRKQGCRKFLAALRHLMTSTACKDPEGRHANLWKLQPMKRLWRYHRHHRRSASQWYSGAIKSLCPQTHIGQRPRCPYLWATDRPLPLRGTEYLEGLHGHLALALLFPPGHVLSAAHQLVCNVRPLVYTGHPGRQRWRPADHWLSVQPALVHVQHIALPHAPERIVVLCPMLPHPVVHGMAATLRTGMLHTPCH